MSEPYRRFVCVVCGWIYDEAVGDPDGGLPAGTHYDDIPDDWSCPLCGVGKSDLQPLPDAPPVVASAERPRRGGGSLKKGAPDAVVIVGAGVAGWSAAEAVRQHDAERPVLLISACDATVYSKPTLSVAYAKGIAPDSLAQRSGADEAQRLGVELLANTRIMRIDRDRKRLITSKGGIRYGQLVLAVGARQRELPIDGAAGREVLRVNDLQSYHELRRQLDAGDDRRVLILGGGLVGCEFAEDLRAGGYGVTVVDMAEQPLSRLLPTPLAERLRERLAEQGVSWRLGVGLAGLEAAGQGYRALLTDGSVLDADVVISAVGLQPNVELAAKAGLATNHGIQVGGDLRSSDPDIFAVGDCAEVEGRVYSYIEPIRRQTQVLGAALTGAAERFHPLLPLVRVKTPSLPVSVCPPFEPDVEWRLVEDGRAGCRMDCWKGDRLVGFALIGELALDASRVYQELLSAEAA